MTTGTSDPLLLDDPYPIYESLRSSMPVCWNGERGVWLVARYKDILCALHDPRLSSAGLGTSQAETIMSLLPFQLEMSDPPDHTRRRTLIQKAFADRGRRDLIELIHHTVSDLLATPLDTGHMDVISDLAVPLTSHTLLQLFGFDNTESKEAIAFVNCVNEVSACLDQTAVLADDGGVKVRNARHALQVLEDIIDGCNNVGQPSLIRSMANMEDMGQRLTRQEIIANIVLLFAAGAGTTRNLIGSGVLELVLHPEEAYRLKCLPNSIVSAVEEMLRYDSPIQLVSRTALSEIQLHGQTVRRGDTVVLILGSANRDEDEFSHATDFDVTRAPNRHLAFGAGSHVCIGAWLARAQAKAAISMLINRTDEIQLAVNRVEWHQQPSFRGPKRVPIFFKLDPTVKRT